MPYKDASVKKLKHAVYSREHYIRNSEKVRKRAAELKRDKRLEWNEFKSTLNCTNCGFNHPAVLDFHHVDRKNKKSVHLLARNGNYKLAREEIKKCIVLCANCHRILHHEERQQKKKKLKSKKKKATSNP